MEAFFTSTLVVALAEIGDKTQLLAIVLAARFRKPWPIVAGILLATIANHALAALVGASAAAWLASDWFRYAVAASFVVMGLWTLVPDKLDDEEAKPAKYGAFLTTLVAFFFVEMGDKTQVATVALAARYTSVLWVAAGTTLGMMLANAPVVFAGSKLVEKIPLNAIRMAAALLFVILGLVMAWQVWTH